MKRAFAVVTLFLAACSSGPEPTPAPAAPSGAGAAVAPPEAPQVAPEAPQVAPEAHAPQVAPAAVPPLPALPPPPSPITLAHARALAHEERWPDSASVYGALFAATPTDARLLSGRGYALLQMDVDGALAAGRADLVRARTLAAGDARLIAMIDHNLELADARSADTRAAEGSGCTTVIEERSAVHAATLVAVVRAILDAHADWVEDFGMEAPATEDEARAALCDPDVATENPGCTTDAPFITRFAPDEIVAAHLVVPIAGGFSVFANLIPAASSSGTCPDEVRVERTLPTDSTRLRVRALLLSNELTLCDGIDDDCMEGCSWASRSDGVLLVSRDGARAVLARSYGDIPDDHETDGAAQFQIAAPSVTESPTDVTVAQCGQEAHRAL